jgi:hypothetical protein
MLKRAYSCACDSAFSDLRGEVPGRMAAIVLLNIETC